MKNRFIAAVALASVIWSSLPVALAVDHSYLLPNALSTNAAVSSHHHHPCCPGIVAKFATLIAPSQPAMPCSDLPCCVKQAPGNPPAVLTVKSNPRPETEGLPVTIADEGFASRKGVATGTFSGAPFPSYSVRSTVLRI